MEKFTEINEEYVKEILKLSQEMFEGILYVKCYYHPCGWDKLDLEDINNIGDTIFYYDISNNIYDSDHPYINLSLFDIIKIVGMKGWSFVPPTICPDDFNSIGI